MHVKQLGFTLIELLLVVTLLSVITAVGANSLLQWQWRTDYLNTLNKAVAAVQRAQHHAQRGYQDYWLGVEPQCLWLHVQADGECQQHGILFRDSAIHWRAAFTHGQQLRFTAGRGLSGFGAGRIRVSHQRFPQHEAAIIVSSLGRVRLCQSERLLQGISLC